MLPSTFGSSVWFTDEQLAEMEGTTLHRAIVMQVSLWCKLTQFGVLSSLGEISENERIHGI
jgi:hypothetical protein